MSRVFVTNYEDKTMRHDLNHSDLFYFLEKERKKKKEKDLAQLYMCQIKWCLVYYIPMNMDEDMFRFKIY